MIKEEKTHIADYVLKKKKLLFLCVCACICVLIFVAGIVFHMHTISHSYEIAQVQQVAQVTDTSKTTTSSKDTSKQLFAPNLVNLMGKNTQEALQLLGSGAQITSTVPVSDINTACRMKITISLTNESGSAVAGTPTVVLGLDEGNSVIQASFQVNMVLLGYGFVSFSDAILNRHVIENTLTEAGLAIPVGQIHLPDNPSGYATYDKDGITVSKEEYTFSGSQVQNNINYIWRGTITFDYSLSNAQSNLSYTQRSIDVMVGTHD